MRRSLVCVAMIAMCLALAATEVSGAPALAQSCTGPSDSDGSFLGPRQTFRNERYGYTLDVPASAEIDARNPADVHFDASIPFSHGADSGVDVLRFTVAVQENQKSLSPEQWVKMVKHGAGGRAPRAVVRSCISGRVAARQEIVEIDEVSVHYFVTGGKFMYNLIYADPASISELNTLARARLTRQYQAMLATFKLQ